MNFGRKYSSLGTIGYHTENSQSLHSCLIDALSTSSNNRTNLIRSLETTYHGGYTFLPLVVYYYYYYHRRSLVFPFGGLTHGERGARTYNGGLGAVPPAGSRGRAPGGGSGGAKPP